MRSTRKPPSTSVAASPESAGFLSRFSGSRTPTGRGSPRSARGPVSPEISSTGALAGDEIVILGNPALRRDLNHVDDVVDAFLRAGAAGAPAGTWNLGAPPTTLGDFAAAIFRALGMPPRIRVKPLPASLASIAVGDFHSDWSAIRADLGWAPRVGLPSGLIDTVRSFRAIRAERVTIPFQRLAAAEDAGVREGPPGGAGFGLLRAGTRGRAIRERFRADPGNRPRRRGRLRHGRDHPRAPGTRNRPGRPGAHDGVFDRLYGARHPPRRGAARLRGLWNGGASALPQRRWSGRSKAGGIAAILPVHLFGAAAAGWKDLVEVAARHGVPILEDACQAHGAHFRGTAARLVRGRLRIQFLPHQEPRRARRRRSGGHPGSGARGAAAAGSAPGARPGGTTTPQPAGTAASTSSRPRCSPAGFPASPQRIESGAGWRAATGRPCSGCRSASPPRARKWKAPWHLFVVRTAERDALRRHLAGAGVETLVHYPVTLPRQAAFSQFVEDGETFPEAERARRRSSQPAAPSAPCGQRGGTGGGRGAFVLRRSAVVAGVRIGRWRSGAPAPCSVRAAASWWEQGDAECLSCGRRNPGLYGFAGLLRLDGPGVMKLLLGRQHRALPPCPDSERRPDRDGGAARLPEPRRPDPLPPRRRRRHSGVRGRKWVRGVQRRLAPRRPAPHPVQHVLVVEPVPVGQRDLRDQPGARDLPRWRREPGSSFLRSWGRPGCRSPCWAALPESRSAPRRPSAGMLGALLYYGRRTNSDFARTIGRYVIFIGVFGVFVPGIDNAAPPRRVSRRLPGGLPLRGLCPRARQARPVGARAARGQRPGDPAFGGRLFRLTDIREERNGQTRPAQRGPPGTRGSAPGSPTGGALTGPCCGSSMCWSASARRHFPGSSATSSSPS